MDNIFPTPTAVPWPEGGEHGLIGTEGGQVSYHLYGKDTPGIPMIFLHGGPGGTCCYAHAQIPLAKERPLVFYNQLGSPGSPFSPEITTAEEAKKYCTVEHYVNEVQTVIDHFGFDRFFLVGSSWGTMLAVEYAAAKQPKGLMGLVLSGPFLCVDTWIQDAQRLIRSLPNGDGLWEEITALEKSKDFGPRYQEINKLYSRAFNNRHPESLVGTPTPEKTENPEKLSVYNYMWGPSEFSCTGTLRGRDSRPLLKAISAPILYVSGQYDSGSPLAAFEYAALTPHGEVCVLPGCAHNSSRERTEEFNTVLTSFANRHSRKTAVRKAFVPNMFDDVCSLLKSLDLERHGNWNWARWEWMFYHPQMDCRQIEKMAVWYWDGQPVGLALYDQYPGEGFCAAAPGFAHLREEILEYAETHLSDENGFRLAVSDTDSETRDSLTARGFSPSEQTENLMVLDLQDTDLTAPLAEGFTLSPVDPEDAVKYHKMLWHGFDHPGEAPIDEETMHKQKRMLTAPHRNSALHIAAVEETGEYAACCGLWFDPETDYAYVEPVCTVPRHRGKGIAKASLFRALQNARELGAKRAFVISDMEFYQKLGFRQFSHFTFYIR